MKRKRWTEPDLLSLPSGENDRFDRKSGALLDDPASPRTLAKALSAFANSGGGHLIIGVKDDGTIDGVPKIRRGRTSTKDWLEQIIPELVSHPLHQKIAHAWLNFVVAPFLSTLRSEQENLTNLKQPWNAYSTSAPDRWYFVELSTPRSANQTQFLKLYAQLKDAFDEHDRLVSRLQAEADLLIRELETSSFLSEAYSRFISHEYLQRIRDVYGPRLERHETDLEMLKSLFGDRPISNRINSIATFMAYDYPESWETHYIWPLWKTYKNDLMQFIAYSPIREQNEKVIKARADLLFCVQGLVSLLEKTQHDLAFRHGEPYEDATLHKEFW